MGDLLRKIKEVYLSPGPGAVKEKPGRGLTDANGHGMDSVSWATRSMPWTGTP